MRIVLFDTVLSGHHLGYVASLTKYLHTKGDRVTFALWAPDHRLSHLSGDERPDRIVFIGSGAVPARLWSVPRGIGALRRLLALASEDGADAVHVLDTQRFEIPLALVRRVRGAPRLIATLIGFPPLPASVARSPGRRLFHRARWWGLRRALVARRVDAILALSPGHRRLLAETVGEEPARGVVVTGYPIPPFGRIERADARRELDLPPDLPILLMIGGMRPDQAPELLLDALRDVPGDWRAVLAGEGNPRQRGILEAVRRELPHPERVILRLQWVPLAHVALYIAAADLVVLPYRRVRGRLSATLDHAVALGRPVVATDLDELGLIVREHGLGVVVDPDDPLALAGGISRLLQDPRLPDPARAARYVAERDWRAVGERIRAVYLDAAASAPPRARS